MGVAGAVGICVPVGVPAGPAAGSGVVALGTGLTIAGAGAGRSVGLAPTATTVMGPVAAGTMAVWGVSTDLIGS